MAPSVTALRFGTHCLLGIMVTAQIMYVNSVYAAYSRSVDRNWSAQLFPEGYSDNATDSMPASSYYIFTLPDAVADAQRLVTSYQALPIDSVAPVTVYSEGGTQSGPTLHRPKLRVAYSDGSHARFVLLNVSSGWPLAQFESEDLDTTQSFLFSVDTMTFSFEAAVGDNTDGTLCYVWSLKVIYDLSTRARILVSTVTTPLRPCTKPTSMDTEQGLSIGAIILAAILLGLRCGDVYLQARNSFGSRPSASEVLRVIDLWTVVSTLGCICVLVFSFTNLITGDSVMSARWTKLFMGFSALTLWSSVVEFMEFNPRYFVLVLTLRKAVPRVGQFLLGVLPVFIGYLLLGMVMFADSCDDFANFQNSAATLFAVVNGDVILDTFKELDFMQTFGNIYIYVYIFLFMYVVLMTIIAIVEESFFSSSRHVLSGEDGEMRPSGFDDEHPLVKADDSIFEVLDSPTLSSIVNSPPAPPVLDSPITPPVIAEPPERKEIVGKLEQIISETIESCSLDSIIQECSRDKAKWNECRSAIRTALVDAFVQVQAQQAQGDGEEEGEEEKRPASTAGSSPSELLMDLPE